MDRRLVSDESFTDYMSWSRKYGIARVLRGRLCLTGTRYILGSSLIAFRWWAVIYSCLPVSLRHVSASYVSATWLITAYVMIFLQHFMSIEQSIRKYKHDNINFTLQHTQISRIIHPLHPPKSFHANGGDKAPSPHPHNTANKPTGATDPVS